MITTVPKVNIRQRFYNDPVTEDAWNDFYFWRFNNTSASMDSIDALASDDIEATTEGAHNRLEAVHRKSSFIGVDSETASPSI